MKCKYCNEPFDNKGKLMNHYKVCPKKPGNWVPMTEEEFAAANYQEPDEVNVAVETLKEIFSQPVCKSLEAPITCEVAGKTYVLVEPEEYIPYECVDKMLARRNEQLAELKCQLSELKQVDAEVDGTIYWPLKRLPVEISLLANGQYVSLKCTGRIRDGKVEIEEAKLT
jgi:hypothetical protein